jgi:hypothetical protein
VTMTTIPQLDREQEENFLGEFGHIALMGIDPGDGYIFHVAPARELIRRIWNAALESREM